MIAYVVLSVMLAILIAFILVEFLSYKIQKCPHTHFAEYRSLKKKQCIDCGAETEIDSVDW